MADIARRQAPQYPATSWLRPLLPAVRLVLHAGAEARAIAARAWGVGFSENACQSESHESRATLWMGPDEYLLIGEETGAVDAAAELAQALATVPHALVDVSHRQIALEIRGQYAEQILAGGCPLDLCIEAFAVGMCTRTICGKADIMLWRTGADRFHVEVWRSFADYLVGLLTEVSRDIVT